MIRYDVNTKGIIEGLRMMRRVGMIGEKRAAFIEIGVGLAARIKKNYLASGLRIRTGNLINSIGWELFSRGDSEGVSVGSFGVPYAAIHEFGFSGKVSVPAHTVRGHQRRISTAFGRKIKERTISVRPYAVKGHARDVQIRERAFIRRSVAADRQRIYRLLQKAYGFPEK